MTNAEVRAKIAQLKRAIKATRRLGIKAPSALVRPMRTLEAILKWTRKQNLAATKLKKYGRIWERHDRRMAKGERS